MRLRAPVVVATGGGEEGEEEEEVVPAAGALHGLSRGGPVPGEGGRAGGWGASRAQAGVRPAPAAAEQLAAGWPPWLVAVAGEALRGWTPRRADTFEKLNKVLCGKHPPEIRKFRSATCYLPYGY